MVSIAAKKSSSFFQFLQKGQVLYIELQNKIYISLPIIGSEYET